MLKLINKKKIYVVMLSLLSLLTLSSIIFTMNTSVFAAVLPNIATVTEKIVNVKDETYNNEDCSNIGGLSVVSNGTYKRMYVLKASNEQNRAVLYFYKDYKNPNSNYGKIELRNLVGHANAMAIDENFIYITAWNSSGSNSDAKNDIVRISRNEIFKKYNSKEEIYKGYMNLNSDGVTVFSAVDENNNVWDKRIFAITNYKANGKFIINDGVKYTDDTTGTEVVSFTTAQISNGKFIVSTSSLDMFSVDTELTNRTGQDICYSPSCGLFITRWEKSSKVNNTIVWIKLNSLDGENREYRSSNSNYRHIVVNKGSEGYSKYEIESLCFNQENELFASVNCYPYDVSKDCIVKISRANATNNGNIKFLGTSINQ